MLRSQAIESGRGQHRRGEVAGDEAPGDLRPLLRGRAPGVFVRVGHDRGGRRRRLVGPGGVDEVGDANEANLARAEGGLERIDLLGGMEPGVEAEAAAAGHHLEQPVGGLVLGKTQHGEERGVDLVADLEAVATVDEDPGAIGGDEGDAGRAGEAGEPGQALVAGGDVLALVGVGPRDQEGVDARLRHRRAQGREPRGAGLRRRAAAEVLEHGGPFRPR